MNPSHIDMHTCPTSTIGTRTEGQSRIGYSQREPTYEPADRIGRVIYLMLLLMMLVLGIGSTSAVAAASPEKVADIALPGPMGRFDYAAFDPQTRLLWLNQMGADRTLVFDPRSGRVAAVIDGMRTPTGITVAPGRRLAFISEAGGLLARIAGHGHITAVDLDSDKPIARLESGHFPDGSAWVPNLGRLFVSNEMGGTETVIGGSPLHVEKTLELGGEAGMSVYDAVSQRILVNVQTRNRIDIIDPKMLKIAAHVDLPHSCQHNHGLLTDAEDHLAFVACDENARLITLSLPRLTLVQPALKTGDEPDVLALDGVRHRLIVASESGVVAIFAIAQERLRPLWRGLIGPDAHVVAVNPVNGLMYFPLQALNGKPVLRVMRMP